MVRNKKFEEVFLRQLPRYYSSFPMATSLNALRKKVSAEFGQFVASATPTKCSESLVAELVAFKASRKTEKSSAEWAARILKLIHKRDEEIHEVIKRVYLFVYSYHLSPLRHVQKSHRVVAHFHQYELLHCNPSDLTNFLKETAFAVHTSVGEQLGAAYAALHNDVTILRSTVKSLEREDRSW